MAPDSLGQDLESRTKNVNGGEPALLAQGLLPAARAGERTRDALPKSRSQYLTTGDLMVSAWMIGVEVGLIVTKDVLAHSRSKRAKIEAEGLDQTVKSPVVRY